MLRRIEFKDKRFRTKEDYNLLSPLTENTIILFYNHKLMDLPAEEILNTVNGKAEYNDYDFSFLKQMLEVFPLVYVTSYNILEQDRKFKSEYIVSQLIMPCIRKLGINAVAYF